MSDPPSLGSIAEWFSAIRIGASGIGVLLHCLLKKTLEKTVDSRFEEKLEKVKQGLRLEEKKQSIVYEQQKDSFRRALMAMHTAEQMLSNSCEIATSVFSKYATARVSWKVSLLRHRSKRPWSTQAPADLAATPGLLPGMAGTSLEDHDSKSSQLVHSAERSRISSLHSRVARAMFLALLKLFSVPQNSYQ